MARRINLAPASERVRTTTNWGVLGVVVGAIIVLFGLGLGYYLLSSTLDDRKQELTAVQQERQRVEAQTAELRQYELLAAERARTEEVVQTVYAGRTLVADILDSISLVVPETVWFQSLNLSTAEPAAAEAAGAARSAAVGALSIEGATYTFEEVAQVIVRLQLIRALVGVDLANASVADDNGKTRGFSVGAAVVNTQDPEMPLPVSQVEVEGL